MADWNFILTDERLRPVGEILNAQDRKVANPLSKLDTASLKVKANNPLAEYMMNCNGYLKAYRDGTMRFMGPLVSAEEVVDAQTSSVAINAVGAGWVLSKRLAGQSATGQLFTALTDRAEIIRQLIVAANAVNETGISTTATVSSASAMTFVAGPYRQIMEIVTELATAYDGFDWRILPQENFVNGAITGQKIASFTAAPIIGSDRTATAIFEFGTGRHNIESYRRAVAREQQANKVFHITSNGPGAYGFPVVSAIDNASIADYRLLEDLAQADLLDQGMRQQLVNEHVRIRKNPKRTIEFTPIQQLSGTSGRLPRIGEDFDVGDFVQAVAAVEGRTKFDIAVRLYGVSFDLDDAGNEKMTLALVEEGT